MKLYAVTYDGYDMAYGCEIYLYGVYSSKEKAEQIVNEYKYLYAEITEIELDKNVNCYLGGYYE